MFPETEWVFFDAVGTLFSLKRPAGEIYLEEAQRFGYPAREQDADGIQKAFREAIRSRGALVFPDAEPLEVVELERRWWRRIVKDVFREKTFSRFDEFFDSLYEAFTTDRFWQLEPSASHTVRRLAASDFKLGVISNFDSRLPTVLSNLGIRSYFKTVIFSSLAPAAKPDPAVFEFALFRSGAFSWQAVHVGDSLEEDYQGATRVGMKALLYQPQQSAGQELPSGVDTIHDLAELLDLLL